MFEYFIDRNLRRPLHKQLFESFVTDLKCQTFGNSIISGPPGSGKLVILNAVYHEILTDEQIRAHYDAIFLDATTLEISHLDQLKGYIESAAREAQASYTRLGITRPKRRLVVFVNRLNRVADIDGRFGLQLSEFLRSSECILLGTTSRPFLTSLEPVVRTCQVYALSREEAFALAAELLKEKQIPSVDFDPSTPVGRAWISWAHLMSGDREDYFLYLFNIIVTKEKVRKTVFSDVMTRFRELFGPRLHVLSVEQKRVLFELCLSDSALSVHEVAERCEISQQTASSLLKRMRTAGFVRQQPWGRESFYQPNDRMMALSFLHSFFPERAERYSKFVFKSFLWHTWYDHECFYRRFERTIENENAQETEAEKEKRKSIAELHQRFHEEFTRLEFSKARQSIQGLIAYESTDSKLWNLLGTIESQLKDPKAAIIAFDEALRLKPDSNRAIYGRVSCLAASGEWDQAFQELDKALKRFSKGSDPNSGDTKQLVETILETESGNGSRLFELTERLIATYARHQAVADLGQGLLFCISKIAALPPYRQQSWLSVWKSSVEQNRELELPVRITFGACEYIRSGMYRPFAQLPWELELISCAMLAEFGLLKPEPGIAQSEISKNFSLRLNLPAQSSNAHGSGAPKS